MTVSAIFNCSNAVKGGALKNSLIFIENSVVDVDIVWYFIVSSQVYRQAKLLHSLPSNRVRILDPTISGNFIFYLLKLFIYIHSFPSKHLYSMGGPIYVPFLHTHYMGISDPYVIFADPRIIRSGRTRTQFISCYFKTLFKRFFSTWSHYFLFQTQSSLEKFSARFNIKSNLFLLSNAYDFPNIPSTSSTPLQPLNDGIPRLVSLLDSSCETFHSAQASQSLQDLLIRNSSFLKDNYQIVFIPGADYPHKGHFLLPSIIREFQQYVRASEQQFLFLTSILPGSHSSLLLHSQLYANTFPNVSIANIGSYSYTTLSSIISPVDICFIPSLLEVFSASYLESFVYKKPSIVANTSFALDICGNASLYADPYDPSATALLILALLNSPELQHVLNSNSIARLNSFPSQKERYSIFKSFFLDSL